MKRYIRSAVRDIHDEHEWDKQAFARDYRTDTRVLMQLAEDYDEYVRKEVARRPNLPIEIQEKLANDELGEVKMELASNPTTSIDIMEKLAADADWRPALGLAFNPNTPEYILRTLVNKAPLALARSQYTPLDVLEELKSNEDPEIRQDAWDTYNRRIGGQ